MAGSVPDSCSTHARRLSTTGSAPSRARTQRGERSRESPPAAGGVELSVPFNRRPKGPYAAARILPGAGRSSIRGRAVSSAPWGYRSSATSTWMPTAPCAPSVEIFSMSEVRLGPDTSDTALGGRRPAA